MQKMAQAEAKMCPKIQLTFFLVVKLVATDEQIQTALRSFYFSRAAESQANRDNNAA